GLDELVLRRAPAELECPSPRVDRRGGRFAMWLGGEETESGRRVHRLVAAALEAERDGERFDVIAATRTMFGASPLGAGATHALRFRCSSAVNVYLLRCRPAGWRLVGTEVPVPGAVADVVWSDGTRVVIDEVKFG